jgi:AcrR family transcriptional regulator
MKKTFDNLPEEKRARIIAACVKEFGEKGYEGSALDRIVAEAGISKGGLYEYIESKEDLFLFIVGLTYDELYDYLEQRIRKDAIALPQDIVKRMRIVAEIAVDFYIHHPHYIEIIVGTNHLPDAALAEKVRSLFLGRFLRLFGNADFSRIPFDRDRVLELLTWLLLKTRYDFLVEFRTTEDRDSVRRRYLEKWNFYVSVLQNGLYGKEGPSPAG